MSRMSQWQALEESVVPGRASELSRRGLCLSLDRLGLLLCGGGSGFDKQTRLTPPPVLLLHPSAGPPPASGLAPLWPSMFCGDQSTASSSLFGASSSWFGEGVLSDGYGGNGLWHKWNALTCLSVFLLSCLLSVHWPSTCTSICLLSDHDLSICLPPIHCLSIFLSICLWVCLSTVHCFSMCLLSVQYFSACLSVILNSPKVLSLSLPGRASIIHSLSARSTSVALCLSSAQYLSISPGCSNTASTSEICQRQNTVQSKTSGGFALISIEARVPLWENRRGVFLGEGCLAQVVDSQQDHFSPDSRSFSHQTPCWEIPLWQQGVEAGGGCKHSPRLS